MRGQEFRKWAEHGVRQYGGDPWFLLRELAQNARDAGARRIRVAAERRGDLEVLELEDDGSGMTLSHARRYLFRLYASSKEEDARNAGRFGIGFWTVLGFEPTSILIESRTAGERWALTVDEGFGVSDAACSLAHRGTRVTLTRRARHDDEAAFGRSVRRGLERNCAYLRQKDRRASPLPVLFHGEDITRPMTLPGMVSYSFRHGPVEGAVGLSETPRVYLHARGLPVWKGTLLEELSHTSRPEPRRCEIAAGVAPVFLLNGNDLDVVMSRRAVVDDRALARVRRAARRAMTRLVHLHLDHTFPRSLPRRAADGLADVLAAAARLGPLRVLAGVALLVVAAAAGHHASERLGAGRTPRPVLAESYDGAVVSGPRDPSAPYVDLTYAPAADAWFKVVTAQSWDPRRGFVTGRDEPLRPHPAATCGRECMRVEVQLASGGRVRLPVPGGYSVDPASVELDGRPLPEVWMAGGADAVAIVPEAGGKLRYRCGPTAADRLGAAALEELTRADGATLPDSVLDVVSAARERSVEERVRAAALLTRGLLGYDASRDAAAGYEELRHADEWLPFVLSQGKGDCDVLNGVNALLLRRMEVPARLAVGLVGRGGRGSTALHAWTEYHDGGWRAVDVTPPSAAAAGSRSTAAPRAPPPPSSTDRLLGVVPAHVAPAAAASSAGPAPAPDAAVRPEPVIPDADAHPAEQRVLPIVLPAALAFSCLLLVVALLVRRSGWEHMSASESPEMAERVLARMMTGALARPGTWGEAHELWSRRVLPTLTDRRISVNGARELARRGRLFTGTRRGALARSAAGAGAVVLDRAHPAFGSLTAGLSGALDLDEVEGWDVRLARDDDDPASRLVGRAGSIVRAAGGGTPVLGAPGMVEYDVADVDLSGIPRSGRMGLPARFVAVATGGAYLRPLVELAETNAPLAAYGLVTRLASDSALLSTRIETLRKRAAEAALEEAAR